jgi:hypothetical protein
MKIVNISKNTVIADHVALAVRPLARLVGLLNRKGLPKGEGLILKPCNSIHTFFMRFPIDALFVDKDYQVVKALPNLIPFRLTGIYLGSAFAIELPANTIQSTNTQQGDLLKIE